jgi:hypothetical protein
MKKLHNLTSLIQGGFKPRRVLSLTLTVTMVVLSFALSSVYADTAAPRYRLPYVGGNVGTADVQNSDRYDSSPAANAYGGFYVVQNLSVELWLGYLGQFDVKGQRDAYSQSNGIGGALAYRIDTGKLFALRPSVGFFYSRTKIMFDGNNIGEDSGGNLMLGLSGVFTIRHHLLVNINSHFYKDVSGADILMFTAGAGYQF